MKAIPILGISLLVVQLTAGEPGDPSANGVPEIPWGAASDFSLPRIGGEGVPAKGTRRQLQAESGLGSFKVESVVVGDLGLTWVGDVRSTSLLLGDQWPVRYAVVRDSIVGFHMGGRQLRWSVQSHRYTSARDLQVGLESRAAALVEERAQGVGSFAEGLDIEGVFGRADTGGMLAQKLDAARIEAVRAEGEHLVVALRLYSGAAGEIWFNGELTPWRARLRGEDRPIVAMDRVKTPAAMARFKAASEWYPTDRIKVLSGSGDAWAWCWAHRTLQGSAGKAHSPADGAVVLWMADGTSWFGPRDAAWVRTASGLSGFHVGADGWLVCRVSATQFPCQQEGAGRFESWIEEQKAAFAQGARPGARVLDLARVPGAPDMRTADQPLRMNLRRVGKVTEVYLSELRGIYRIRVDDALGVVSADFAAALRGPTQEEDPSFMGPGGSK